MDLIIDTFSWKKLDLLTANGLFNLKDLYRWAEIYITAEVLTEVKHFEIKSCNPNLITILSIKNLKIYQDARDLNFDEADAEILSNGTKTLEKIIISEDHPLLKFAQGFSLKALQIADLFHFFTIEESLDKKELYRIVKYLREMKNITKKKAKDIEKWINDN